MQGSIRLCAAYPAHVPVSSPQTTAALNPPAGELSARVGQVSAFPGYIWQYAVHRRGELAFEAEMILDTPLPHYARGMIRTRLSKRHPKLFTKPHTDVTVLSRRQ